MILENIIISNKERLDSLVKEISQQGKENFLVASDFDRTITKAFVDNQKTPTIIGQIREGGYLMPDYAKKAFALFDKYHPVEVDPSIPRKEKSAKMEEWWKAHFNLLFKCGLDKKLMDEIIAKRTIWLREGAGDFFDILHKNNIPLVIVSAAPGYMLQKHLEQEGKIYPNVHIIANFFKFDQSGQAVGLEGPLIHSLNKNEAPLKECPFFNSVKNRKNILLLGDGPEDIEITESFKPKLLLKIGFLNENIEQNMAVFQKNFDVILLKDPDMGFVNKILKEIIG